MTILMISDASDGTRAHDDEVSKRLDAAGQRYPPGRRSHGAAGKGSGYLVVDIWESQAARDRFVQLLVPLFEQVGGAVAQRQVYPIHNRIQAT